MVRKRKVRAWVMVSESTKERKKTRILRVLGTPVLPEPEPRSPSSPDKSVIGQCFVTSERVGEL